MAHAFAIGLMVAMGVYLVFWVIFKSLVGMLFTISDFWVELRQRRRIARGLPPYKGRNLTSDGPSKPFGY